VVGTVGESAVVPPGLAGWNVARAIAVIRPEGVSAHWLRLVLQTREARENINGVLNTTVQATLNLSDLKRLLIPMPPQPMRDAITEILGALDDKIVVNGRIANNVTRLADALYEAELAFSIEANTIGGLATSVLGGTPSRAKPEYWTDGDVPWISSGKANEDRVLEPTEWITEEALEKSAAKLMPVKATILAITGATLGQVARLEIATSGNQSLIGIWHNDAAMNDWLYFSVRHGIDELLKHATGAAQQHVNKGVVDALKVPVPVPGRLRRWGRSVRPLLDRAAAADRESLRLRKAHSELLPLLMSGRVRVKDAEKVVEETL
jgi:type I restriction enzyme S subunit